jgi:nucleoid DNA-binding protein
MASSRIGRDKLIAKVQSVLGLKKKKEAEHLVTVVVACIEEVLADNLHIENFSMKLNSFGKFTVKHKKGIERKIPFTGEIKTTKSKRKVRFHSLGKLRKLEPVE